jgi:hypothetical protein
MKQAFVSPTVRDGGSGAQAEQDQAVAEAAAAVCK